MAEDHHGESLMEKISDKIKGHKSSTSSSSSSSSDDEKEKKNVPASVRFRPPEVVPESEKSSAQASAVQSPSSPSSPAKTKIPILNRKQTIHKVLGGGKPADVFLWRNKKASAIGLGVATFIWFLFESLEYHLLTLICHILMFVLTLLFLWSYASKFKPPPQIPDVQISEKTLLEFTAAVRFNINRALHVLRDIASGKDLKRFLQVIGGLWIVSIVASWFTFLTLFYLIFVLLHTVPSFYEKYEHQVDAVAEKAMVELGKQYAVVDAKYLSKIPKGPSKSNKFA